MDASTKTKFPATEPRSLLRILGIFEAISGSAEGMTLAELSAALAAPKSSLLLLLRPLVAHGYLVHLDSRYELGPSIFQLSSAVLSAREFTKVIRPFIEELAARSNESAYLTTIDRENKIATYVDAVDSKQAVRYSVPVGTVRPLYASAAGKVLLAHQDSPWQARYIKSTKFKPLTDKPVIEKAALQEELVTIRSRGYATSNNDAVVGAAGIAAPILRPDGNAAYALMIAAPSSRFEKALPSLRQILLDVANRASRALGELTG